MKNLYILIAVLVFGVLILIHELGHYIFARIFKVKIYEFSLGMGPTLISRTSKKTGIKYSVSLFPIGGYVSMAGEDENTDEPNALNRKPVWQRMIITVAGAFMNFLLGVVIMFFVVSNSVIGTTVVAGFIPIEETNLSVSSEGYLQKGDKIISVNGFRVHTSAELDYEILHSGGGQIDMTVIRNGEETDIKAEIPSVVQNGVSYGTRDFIVYREGNRSLGTLIKHTWFRSTSTVKMIWESLIDLISGKYGIEAMSGPVGVAGAITDAASSGAGALNVAYIAAVISMNLGVFNLLPFPALDGGRLVFLAIEGIRRKPVPVKVEGYINGVGLLLLFGLMIIVTFKDIFTIFF